MNALGYTPSEPIREDEAPWDPYELVPCPTCKGKKVLTEERRGTVYSRTCRMCGGRGEVLLGNPPDSPYSITFDFCTGAFPCCREGS